LSGSLELEAHAQEAAQAISIRTGRQTTHTIKGDQLLVRTTGDGLYVRYRFIPSADGEGCRWHYAAIDFELATPVEPTDLRQHSWLRTIGAKGHWQKLTVLEAELGLKSVSADRYVLQRELQLRRVGLDELRVATAAGHNLHVSFLSPRPRSASVIFERAADLHEAMKVAWSDNGEEPFVRTQRWTERVTVAPVVDDELLGEITAPFSGEVESGGGRAWARVSLAGHVDERLTGVVEIDSERVDARFQVPPSPDRLSLVPQEGVLGWLRSFAEDQLGHEALDEAFLVEIEGEALAAFATRQAPPLLRLRDLGLHLEIADGWLMVTDLNVPADKHEAVIADVLELWRQLSLELVGLERA
jgi:hypothetical protein